MNKQRKIIISGGGTGGHIFPAISIANALKQIDSSIKILFVGAEDRMEMEKVPAAGYEIIGLPISGFQRRLTFKNVTFFFKLFRSLIKSKRIIKSFKPDAVVGVGGFASGPLLQVASQRRVPALIQEQNSYPGITNKLLAGKAQKICVAYEGMERFFPKDKIMLTGNPVRQDLFDLGVKKEEGLQYFGLAGNKKTLLVVGGSLGALTINDSIYNKLDEIIDNKIQLIWQTGKAYYEKAKAKVEELNTDCIKVMPFISRMDYAYSVADIVVSRAGASTISELCMVHKASIFVPSPNVSEDHQTKNAMALVKNNAAMMVEDRDAREKLIGETLKLLQDDFRVRTYQDNIAKMALKDSATIIANEVLAMIKE